MTIGLQRRPDNMSDKLRTKPNFYSYPVLSPLIGQEERLRMLVGGVKRE
jgi:hypothetical protein